MTPADGLSNSKVSFTGREQVVLAVQTQGPGRTAAFTPQDSWVWVMNAKVDSPAHERFWRSLLAWLVEAVPK